MGVPLRVSGCAVLCPPVRPSSRCPGVPPCPLLSRPPLSPSVGPVVACPVPAVVLPFVRLGAFLVPPKGWGEGSYQMVITS